MPMIDSNKLLDEIAKETVSLGKQLSAEQKQTKSDFDKFKVVEFIRGKLVGIDFAVNRILLEASKVPVEKEIENAG